MSARRVMFVFLLFLVHIIIIKSIKKKLHVAKITYREKNSDDFDFILLCCTADRKLNLVIYHLC